MAEKLNKQRRYYRSWKGRITHLLHFAKRRAKHRALSFSLSAQWLRDQLEAHDFKCAVTGVAFSLEDDHNARYMNPYAPSIDRIDPSRGYDPDNCRVVCQRYNLWKGQAADDKEIIEFAKLVALSAQC